MPDSAPRLNAAEMLVDVAQPEGGVSTRWIADSGALDLFPLLGPAPADVAAQYAAISGTTAMYQARHCPNHTVTSLTRAASSTLTAGARFLILASVALCVIRQNTVGLCLI